MEQALEEFLINNPNSTAEEIKSGMRRQGFRVSGKMRVSCPQNCVLFLRVSSSFTEAWTTLVNKNVIKWKSCPGAIFDKNRMICGIPLTTIPQELTEPHYLCATYEYVC